MSFATVKGNLYLCKGRMRSVGDDVCGNLISLDGSTNIYTALEGFPIYVYVLFICTTYVCLFRVVLFNDEKLFINCKKHMAFLGKLKQQGHSVNNLSIMLNNMKSNLSYE